MLAALSVPPSSPVLDLNLLEYDLEHEKTKRMAQMLSFPSTASRATLLAELVAGGLLEAASPEVRARSQSRLISGKLGSAPDLACVMASVRRASCTRSSSGSRCPPPT